MDSKPLQHTQPVTYWNTYRIGIYTSLALVIIFFVLSRIATSISEGALVIAVIIAISFGFVAIADLTKGKESIIYDEVMHEYYVITKDKDKDKIIKKEKTSHKDIKHLTSHITPVKAIGLSILLIILTSTGTLFVSQVHFLGSNQYFLYYNTHGSQVLITGRQMQTITSYQLYLTLYTTDNMFYYPLYSVTLHSPYIAVNGTPTTIKTITNSGTLVAILQVPHALKTLELDGETFTPIDKKIALNPIVYFAYIILELLTLVIGVTITSRAKRYNKERCWSVFVTVFYAIIISLTMTVLVVQ